MSHIMTGATSTAVRVTPSGGTGAQVEPSQPPPATATITPVTQPFATVAPHYSGSRADSNKVAVYSRYQDTFVPMQLDKKSFRKKKILPKCQEILDAAKEFARKRGGSKSVFRVAVDIIPDPDIPERDHITISYRVGDEGTLRYIEDKDIPKEIRDKIEEVRKVLKPEGATIVPTPLQPLPHSVKMPKTCEEFLRTNYEALEANLPKSAKENAVARIVASEAILQGLIKHLSDTIRDKEEELGEGELEELRRLHARLQSADRYAIYWAAAFCDDLSADLEDEATGIALRQKAHQISIGMKTDLSKKEKAEQDRFVNNWLRNGWVGKKLGFERVNQPRNIHQFALDGGDLVLLSKEERNRQQWEGGADITKSPVEELVIRVLMNLEREGEVPIATDPILGRLSEGNRKIVSDLISIPERQDPNTQFFPRAWARDVYREISGQGPIEGANLPGRVDQLVRRHPEVFCKIS